MVVSDLVYCYLSGGWMHEIEEWKKVPVLETHQLNVEILVPCASTAFCCRI